MSMVARKMRSACVESSFFDDFSEGTPGQPLEAPWEAIFTFDDPVYDATLGAIDAVGGDNASGAKVPGLAGCCGQTGLTLRVAGRVGEYSYTSTTTTTSPSTITSTFTSSGVESPFFYIYGEDGLVKVTLYILQLGADVALQVQFSGGPSNSTSGVTFVASDQGQMSLAASFATDAITIEWSIEAEALQSITFTPSGDPFVEMAGAGFGVASLPGFTGSSLSEFSMECGELAHSENIVPIPWTGVGGGGGGGGD